MRWLWCHSIIMVNGFWVCDKQVIALAKQILLQKCTLTRQLTVSEQGIHTRCH